MNATHSIGTDSNMYGSLKIVSSLFRGYTCNIFHWDWFGMVHTW